MSDNSLSSIARNAELLASEKSVAQRMLENPFVNAAAHTLLQSPLDAAAQLVDKTTGSNLLPNMRIVPDAQPTKFGTVDWAEQQLGSAVGALPYLIALHQGSRAALSSTMLSADTKLMLNAGVKLGASGTSELMRLELASAGLTGAAYGGLLTQVRADEMGSTGSFIGAKLRNAAVGGGTFLTMSGAMMGSKAFAEGLNPGVFKTVLSSDIGAGVISGLPAGLVNAQSDSLLRGNGIAGWKATSESMIGFAAIGGLMPAGQKGVQAIAGRFEAVTSVSKVAAIESVDPARAEQLKEPGSAPAVKAPEHVFNPEQMKTINEWKDAQARLAETKFRETQPELIKKLADEAYGTGAAEKGHKLHILLGNCGAGKSRVTEGLAKELGAMTPDSDNIKAKIDGYDKGMGNQAVHEDSSAAYKLLLDRALQNGDNIVWQGVGKTAKSVTDLINQAKEHGYEVVVHMIDAPPEVAAMRVFNRAQQEPHAETGVRQMIPPEVPLNSKYQYVPRLNFFKMIGEAAERFHAGEAKTIDGFRMWRSTSEAHSSFLPTPGFIPNLSPSFAPTDSSHQHR